jgi:hypothetical protein
MLFLLCFAEYDRNNSGGKPPARPKSLARSLRERKKEKIK